MLPGASRAKHNTLQLLHARIHWRHPLLTQIRHDRRLSGLKRVGYLIQKITVHAGNAQISHESGKSASRCTDTEADRSSQQPYQTAERSAAYRPDRRVAIAFMNRERPIRLLRDQTFGMDGDGRSIPQVARRAVSAGRWWTAVANPISATPSTIASTPIAKPMNQILETGS